MREQWVKETQDKFNIKGLTVLTAYDVYNMLVGALEGGSNYWYYISENMTKHIYKKTEDMNGEPYVDRMLMAIQRGLKVKIRDGENPGDVLGTLTAESWAKGEKLIMEKQREHFADIVGERDDATTADVYFQFAVMGELVFG